MSVTSHNPTRIKLTLTVDGENPVPVIVNSVPPSVEPKLGVTDVTVARDPFRAVDWAAAKMVKLVITIKEIKNLNIGPSF